MPYFVPRICSFNFYTALRIVAQTGALGFIPRCGCQRGEKLFFKNQ